MSTNDLLDRIRLRDYRRLARTARKCGLLEDAVNYELLANAIQNSLAASSKPTTKEVE
jgi:hypothetical protein